MNKSIIICLFLIISMAYTEAFRRRCPAICQKNVFSKIVCIREGKNCRKLRQCSLEEENCQRRVSNRPRLIPTRLSLCNNIKSSEGSGVCAIIRIPRSTPRLECNNIRCTIPTDKPLCYRSKRNNCRLLTSCQLSRANCQRGSKNLLKLIDARACEGIKDLNRKQKCRPIPKRG